MAFYFSFFFLFGPFCCLLPQLATNWRCPGLFWEQQDFFLKEADSFFFFYKKRQYPRRGFVRAVSSTRDLGYALTRSCAIFRIGPWLILQCQLLSSLYGGHVVGCLNHRCTWDDWGCPILILSKRRGEGKWIGIYTDPTRKWMEGVTQFSHSKEKKEEKGEVKKKRRRVEPKGSECQSPKRQKISLRDITHLS